MREGACTSRCDGSRARVYFPFWRGSVPAGKRGRGIRHSGRSQTRERSRLAGMSGILPMAQCKSGAALTSAKWRSTYTQRKRRNQTPFCAKWSSTRTRRKRRNHTHLCAKWRSTCTQRKRRNQTRLCAKRRSTCTQRRRRNQASLCAQWRNTLARLRGDAGGCLHLPL